MLATTKLGPMRRMASSAVHHLIRAPNPAVVQTLLKSPGDACAYGEPVALLKVSSEAQPLTFTSPVSGQILAVKVKVGDNVRPETDFAIIEGRKPLIQFRYGKGRLMSSATAAGSGSNSVPPSAPPASQQNQQPQTPAAPVSENRAPVLVRRKSFLDVPANYGRLPPMSPKEMALLLSGGAYDSEEIAKPKSKKAQ